MEFKLETVMENVLWTLLIRRDSYINEIQSGDSIIYADQLAAIKDEVMREVENYFIEDESIVVIVTFGSPEYEGDIKIYHMNDLTGEIKLLRICKIDEPSYMINNEYLSKHYHMHWFSRDIEDIVDENVIAYDYANDKKIVIENNIATITPEELFMDDPDPATW